MHKRIPYNLIRISNIFKFIAFVGYVPSTTAGIDSLFIGVTSDSLNFKLDTIKFNVNEDSNGNHIWGRDNGILTGYNAWTNGMTPDGFRTSDANTGEADYSLRVMYCTPATVPQGWVIRGVEIVPATRTGYALAGAKLDAHLSIDSADATGATRKTSNQLWLNPPRPKMLK